MEDILSGPNKGVMFYFPRRKQITAQLDSVLFVTAIGNMEIIARFRPTAMIYRGELAL